MLAFLVLKNVFTQHVLDQDSLEQQDSLFPFKAQLQEDLSSDTLPPELPLCP